MLIKAKGIIEFSPPDVTKKHKKQSSWKRVAMIKTNCDLDLYYTWFIKKRFNLELNKNLRGTHITFISDRMDSNTFDNFSKLFNGKEIEFFINTDVRTDGLHWWLNVQCPEAESIRELMGLERHPYYGFHLTLGHANDKNLEHSKYIHRMCLMFDI